jgi:hypothetical protein
MIDQLISKIQNTNEQAIREWWGPEISNEFTSIIDSLEWDSNGCYQIGLDHVIYHNFSKGRTGRLVKNYDGNSWHLYQRLYLKTHESKKIRVTVPINRELIEVNGEIWEFTDSMRPGKFNGETMKKELVVRDDSDINYIAEQYYFLYQSLIEIANEENSKIPVISFNHMHFDDIGCYFILDGLEWKTDITESIKILMATVDSATQLLGTTKQQLELFKELIKEKLGSLL